MKIIKKYNNEIQDFDIELLEYLVEKYNKELLLSESNKKEHINEYSYYGSDGGFNKTGGSLERGLKGLLHSIPSLLLTPISWPTALLAAIGAVSYRMQKKYEDRKAILNRANPGFWSEYVATNRREKKENRSSEKDKDKKKENKDNKRGFWDKTKKALGIGGAAAAGAIAGAAAKELTPEEEKNIDFKEYWITLSNDEVLRVRADNEDNAKLMANMIIAYTVKSTYDMLNTLITSHKTPRYKFVFDDGEVCYWSAATKEKAINEARSTRKNLCEQLNKISPDLMALDELDIPEIKECTEVSVGEKIPLPQINNFKRVSTTPPNITIEEKNLPSPPYKWGSFNHYRARINSQTFTLPAPNDMIAEEIIQKFISQKENLFREIQENFDNKETLYKVTMPCGDSYYIAGRTEYYVEKMAMNLYNAKNEIIENVLSYNDDDLEQFNTYLAKFGKLLNKIKSFKQAPNTVSISNNNILNLWQINKDFDKGKELINKKQL